MYVSYMTIIQQLKLFLTHAIYICHQSRPLSFDRRAAFNFVLYFRVMLFGTLCLLESNTSNFKDVKIKSK
jgi:hypothetical protein